ncbi:murein transglycosylase A [Halomonas sp. WWR20]
MIFSFTRRSIGGTQRLLNDHWRTLVLLGLACLISACSSRPLTPASPVEQGVSQQMQRMTWQDLPGWSQDNVIPAWSAFLASCTRLERKTQWAEVCADARRVDPLDNRAIRQFFENRCAPYLVTNEDGSVTGLITGYYEPILRGSRERHGAYQVPLYRFPAAWQAHPNRVRASRAELLRIGALRDQELVWVDDPIEAAFLQIQGSGRIELAEGDVMRVGFAGTNQQPFRSFSRWLIERGDITPAQATLPGIRRWAKLNPARVEELLNVNPRMVFFRELEAGESDPHQGPIGALGVPLTSERSIAVDPARIPLGAPVFLATTRPLSNEPLQRLMVAQDTGSAIKGAVRADFYWGHGDSAGEIAGRMKQQGQMWVVMPKSR